MLRPAFIELELSYGCHDARWILPDQGRPVVVAGPNGAGKTTMMEGLLRTLFGFERRRGGDAVRLEARRPWAADRICGAVTVTRGEERYRVERDFTSDRVVVRGGGTRFDGDGNPGSRNQEARHYRRILQDLVGLPDLEGYGCTLFVRQGGLIETSLGEHLLRVAAGGHARVDAARREIAEAHRAVTRRPLHASARAAINARELEKLDDEIQTVRARLESARQAGERRGPLALERERTAERLGRLDAEIGRLERAQSELARSGALELEATRLRERVRDLESRATSLRRAIEELDAATAAWRDAAGAGLMPDDFPARLARADVRWQDREALGVKRGATLGLLGVGLAAAAVALWLAGQFPAATAAGAGAALALTAWLVLVFDGRRRRRTVDRELARTFEGVPGADGIRPGTRNEFLRRFEAQRAAARRLADARAGLADAMRSARAGLRSAPPDAVEADVADEADRAAPGTPGTAAIPGASRLARRLAGGAERLWDRYARARSRMDAIGELSLSLPDGVPPTEEGVAEALTRRRAERARLQEALQTVGQELLERGTPAESTDALEAALASLIPRREALDLKARVYEAAHALVADAYDAFRDRDQERLVAFVSRHAGSLTRGQLGAVEAPVDLEDARVRMHGRLLELSSPPLSYGEWHALLLAVRLGAADFLAGIGVLPPLILDEPFAHLDRDRAAATWALLGRVAADRQVLITTQDELLLERLGIEPDIRLSAERA